MQFSKWHALGNSYLLLERAARRPLEPELASRLCDIRYGIGADGVLEVLESDGSDATVAIWNPDGSPAEFSGNGTRIAALWLARRAGVDAVSIARRRAHVCGHGEGRRPRRDCGRTGRRARDGDDRRRGRAVELTPVSVGNPHAVVRRRAGS